MLRPFIQRAVVNKEPLLWLNEHWLPLQQVPATVSVSLDDVYEAEARLSRFAPVLQALFPELVASGGIIESPLRPAGNLQRDMTGGRDSGQWFIKCDHALPVAGSIKARGGIYEVLVHAEALARRAGLTRATDDRPDLASPEARALFGGHQVAVGSTGNLGLSIGLAAAALGFRATVHMSADAKAWKKARLRAHGVEVVEHSGDYGAAVAAGRAQAQQSSTAYLTIEPSAAAGLRGPQWMLHSEQGRQYLSTHDLLHRLNRATHILWTTGGDLVPAEEYRRFYERGRHER